MIVLTMKDGTEFHPEDAEITLTLGEGEGARVFKWADIARMSVMEPNFFVADGHFGPAKMPVRGLVFEDASDLRVEVPMPVQAAADIGEQLMLGSKIQAARSVSSELLVAQKKEMVLPPGVSRDGSS